jgi:flagellar basal-body rod protein FlgG
MNPAGLDAKGENLFAETASSGAPIINTADSNGTGYLSQGYVETSNVDVVEEMTNMISAQRAYEINSKAVTASDQMLQELTQMT